jgi:hypothetical protein
LSQTRKSRPLDNHRSFSQVRNTGTFGVLRLVLRPAGYDWRFLPEAGRTFTDAGHGACH